MKSVLHRARFLGTCAGREFLAVLLVLILALLVRLPNLMTIPALTDEFKEVGWALRMIEQNSFPLVAVDAYDGPLFAYLLSFVFRVFGQNLYLPRVFVLVAGVLTVAATCYLGKQLTGGDRRAGVIAALLLGVNAHHILFNSHVAWSNDTTPLFTTLAVLAYLRATRAARPAWLLVAAALYACAVQTHPSALAFLPGLALDLVLTRSARVQLRTPYPYAAALVALLVYSPVLYYNLTRGLGSLQPAASATYAFETHPTLARSLVALGPTLAAMGRVALGSMEGTGVETLWTDPELSAFVFLTVAACICMMRRGEKFPALALVGALLFLATFNRFRAMPDSSRYFQPLNPLIFSTWSAFGLAIWDRSRLFGPRRRVWLARGTLGLAGVGLILLSLGSLMQYNEEMQASGRDNQSMLAMVEAASAAPADTVLIEYQLSGLRTGRGGNVADDLAYLFQLDRHKTRFVSISNDEALAGLRGVLRESRSVYLISFGQATDALGTDFPLQPLLRGLFPCPSCQVPNEFILYRWENPEARVMMAQRLRPKNGNWGR